ncbi:MAG: DUF6174 domain-containing protein [Actinomycetota bacterium]
MRTRLLVLTLAAGLALAACRDDPEPVVAGDTTPTTAPDSAPSTVAPATTAPEVTAAPDTTAAPETTMPEELPVGATGGGGSAESGEELEAELAAARERWAVAGPTAYTMELGVVCFCLAEYVGPFVVEVDAGTILSVAYADGALATGDVPADADIRSVDDVFGVIESWIGDADEVRVTYDDETGLPTDVWVDPSFQMADEEIGYTIALVDRADA